MSSCHSLALHPVPVQRLFQKTVRQTKKLAFGLWMCALLLSGSAVCLPQLAQAQVASKNAALELFLEQAKSQLQNNQPIEALQSAQQAVSLSANDYRSHYYLSLALMALQRYPEAQAAASKAQSVAPSSASAAVQNLTAEISKRSMSEQLLAEAQRAADEGLSAKAARLFDQAWQASPDKPELALKSAEIYRDTLSQPIDAGRILWQVVKTHSAKPAGQQAREQLAKLQDLLNRQASTWMADAEKQNSAEALKLLDKAEAIAPSLSALPMARLMASSRGDNLEAVQSALKGLARAKQANLDNIGKMAKLTDWLKLDAFNSFLDDLFSTELAQKIRQIPAMQIEKQRRYEERVANWEAENRRLSEKFERDNIDYKACGSEQLRNQMECIKNVPGPSWFGSSRTDAHVEADRLNCRRQHGPQNCYKPEPPKPAPRPTLE